MCSMSDYAHVLETGCVRMSVCVKYKAVQKTLGLLVLLTVMFLIKSNQFVTDRVPGVVSSTSPARKNLNVDTRKPVQKPWCKHKINIGRLHVNFSSDKTEIIESFFKKTVLLGGKYEPSNCTSKQQVAIIIPYRDREEHLKIFLRHMHPFLQRQQLNYSIFVIEMDKHLEFNRAMLMNIGFVEAMKLANYTCFVFHDVDLLPEDNRIPYYCAGKPQHLSVAIDKLNYQLPYKRIFGGACSINTEHFRMINGFSNMFFGWGGEDDDLYRRVQHNNLSVMRPPEAIARYRMINHTKDENINPNKGCLLKSTRERMSEDGLSNLLYTVKGFELRPLYTWVLIQVNIKTATGPIFSRIR